MLKECNAFLTANSQQTGFVMIDTGDCRAPTNTSMVDVTPRANNGCEGCPDNGAGYGTVN